MAAAEAGTLGSGTAGQAFAMRHAAIIERVVGDQMDQEVGTRVGNYIASAPSPKPPPRNSAGRPRHGGPLS